MIISIFLFFQGVRINIMAWGRPFYWQVNFSKMIPELLRFLRRSWRSWRKLRIPKAHFAYRSSKGKWSSCFLKKICWMSRCADVQLFPLFTDHNVWNLWVKSLGRSSFTRATGAPLEWFSVYNRIDINRLKSRVTFSKKYKCTIKKDFRSFGSFHFCFLWGSFIALFMASSDDL